MTDERTIAKFDEYKFIADSTQRLTERRLAAGQGFVGINSFIVAALTFTFGTATIERQWVRAAIALPLLVVGMVVCLFWARTIEQYRTLIAFRHRELVRIEQGPGMEGAHQLYTREMAMFDAAAPDAVRLGFSRTEAWLPRLFLGAYVVVALGAVALALADRL